MNIHRRLFLKQGGIALAAIGAGAYWDLAFLGRAALAAESAQAQKKVLVVIFQRGAVDGMSMVVPHGDPFYYKYRQEIAIDRPTTSGAEGGALDLDGYFALHPAMSAMLPLYKAGHLAIVHACGSPSASRSHFDMQDFMEAGVPDDKSVHTGWLNRVLAQQKVDKAKLSPFRAVAMSSVLPRTLQGDADALALRDLNSFGVAGQGKTNVAAGFEGMYDSAVADTLHGAGRESFEAISILKQADPTRYTPAKDVDYPAGLFGRSLMQVAQLIKAQVGLEMAFVEVDGWDTHANQGNANGQLAGRLYDFSRGIAAFNKDLGDRMSDVMLLTMSEFGRAARQNGNRGTDHGHGTCFFALGGNVAGGKVLGDWPTLAPEKLFEERDLAVTTDFRAVFAEICRKHLDVPAEAMGKVLPGYQMDEGKFRGILKA
ncbi:MAG TPA: DUF1501 domain-containing protein [Humisphaera sp.]|jgi:uncharacterized protein (DUF1501 family)|nr:DUF1501 domain-containing protein [Humisphaera sp.]